jgi:hypothetical protein
MMDWIKRFFKKEVLWESKDAMYPQYSVKVVRLRPYVGRLSVSYYGQVFFKKNVTIAYDAKFGVDFYDLETWAVTACAVSDKHAASLSARTEY